ncbi:hypothetical protein FP362_14330, partial [Enterobacter hormaechei]|nr:hypothetical protein [Enterobacter hormaechei]
MDAALLNMMRSDGRNKAWAETMVNMEARKLVNTANTLSAFHLSDSLTRMKFVQEIRDLGNDSNLLIVFYVQIMPDDFVMQLHR